VSRYPFLRSPRWILFTAGMALLVVVMVSLALWQLRRLDDRKELNARIEEREASAAVPVGDLVGRGSSASQLDDADWRNVSATGEYDPSAQVLIRNRSFDGRPGYHVVTPLRLADGSALLVNRGWIPLETDGQVPQPPTPPAGEATITARVRLSQVKGRFFSPDDPAEGTLTQLYRVDVSRIGQQLGYPVLPVYVELEAPSPAGADGLPALIPQPELDDGPHLAYFFQWCFFSLCVVAGWILAVRHSAAERDKAMAAAAGAGAPPGPPSPAAEAPTVR
jgi:surfeit locus 1 family protein